ncbi:alpha/beta hydrolase [Yoonia sp. MH D7]
MSDTGDVIFAGTHLRATLFNSDAQRLLVTFSFREKARADFNVAQMSHGAATRGFAQLCIATRRNDWFINDDTAALEATLRILGAQYEAVHMLGFSMGGYGAFRFAHAVNATYATAISPQFSIHPDVMPFDSRYRSDAAGFDKEAGDLVGHAQPALQGVILVDPFRRLDMANAQMIGEVFPRVRLARLGFGGHPATSLLRRTRKSGIVQQVALDAPPRPAPIVATHRAMRLDDASYIRDLLARLEKRTTDRKSHKHDHFNM